MGWYGSLISDNYPNIFSLCISYNPGNICSQMTLYSKKNMDYCKTNAKVFCLLALILYIEVLWRKSNYIILLEILQVNGIKIFFYDLWRFIHVWIMLLVKGSTDKSPANPYSFKHLHMLHPPPGTSFLNLSENLSSSFEIKSSLIETFIDIINILTYAKFISTQCTVSLV